ncbi:hypothetical protein EDD22DRAFT_1050093 [Suillus occidentalis]|nr:hypothetical protein EDD22DRAFT_1050093 [Suillus occidentalis]
MQRYHCPDIGRATCSPLSNDGRSRQMRKRRVSPSFVTTGQGAAKGKALLVADKHAEFVFLSASRTAIGDRETPDEVTHLAADLQLSGFKSIVGELWEAGDAVTNHVTVVGCTKVAWALNRATNVVMSRKHEVPTLHAVSVEVILNHSAATHFPVIVIRTTIYGARHSARRVRILVSVSRLTAVGDEKTPDEVIHLAAGLQFSGFKSAIGTLWQVDDAVAKHVAKAFDEKMFEDLKDGGVMDCTKAARALNHATYFVKKVVPLEQRIVFIHIGFLSQENACQNAL